jgi:hypothetical protein
LRNCAPKHLMLSVVSDTRVTAVIAQDQFHVRWLPLFSCQSSVLSRPLSLVPCQLAVLCSWALLSSDLPIARTTHELIYALSPKACRAETTDDEQRTTEN